MASSDDDSEGDAYAYTATGLAKQPMDEDSDDDALTLMRKPEDSDDEDANRDVAKANHLVLKKAAKKRNESDSEAGDEDEEAALRKIKKATGKQPDASVVEDDEDDAHALTLTLEMPENPAYYCKNANRVFELNPADFVVKSTHLLQVPSNEMFGRLLQSNAQAVWDAVSLQPRNISVYKYTVGAGETKKSFYSWFVRAAVRLVSNPADMRRNGRMCILVTHSVVERCISRWLASEEHRDSLLCTKYKNKPDQKQMSASALRLPRNEDANIASMCTAVIKLKEADGEGVAKKRKDTAERKTSKKAKVSSAFGSMPSDEEEGEEQACGMEAEPPKPPKAPKAPKEAASESKESKPPKPPKEPKEPSESKEPKPTKEAKDTILFRPSTQTDNAIFRKKHNLPDTGREDSVAADAAQSDDTVEMASATSLPGAQKAVAPQQPPLVIKKVTEVRVYTFADDTPIQAVLTRPVWGPKVASVTIEYA
jgi:hypothetical protein